MSPDQILDTALGAGYSIAVLALIAVGLAVVFGMMGIINFAHGEFLMMGAMLTIWLANAGVELWLSMVIATVSVALFGALVEWLLIRRLYGRIEATMLATFGLSQIMVQTAVLIWGSSPQGVGTPLGSFSFGVYSYAWYNVLVMVAAVAIMAGVYFFYTRSRFGMMARAVTMNPKMAAAVGINSARVNLGNFAFGSALAGAGGALLAPLVAVSPSMGIGYIASAFVTVVLGGAGVVTGTALSAGALGLVQRLVSDSTTAFLGTAAILVLAIVLVRIMPTGISGRLKKEL